MLAKTIPKMLKAKENQTNDESKLTWYMPTGEMLAQVPLNWKM